MNIGDGKLAAADELHLIVRNISYAMVRMAVIHTRVYDGDAVTTLIATTASSANLAHVAYTSPEARRALPGIAFNPAWLRPVSINALAKSIHVPYENVRSRVEKLVRRGDAERRDHGLVILPASLSTAPLLRSWDEVDACFRLALRNIRTVGLDVHRAFNLPAPTPGQPPPPARLVTRIFIDFEIRQLENLMPAFGDVPRAIVWSAIIGENLRYMLTDPEISRRHVTKRLVGNDEREPVSINAIARLIEQPYETTRRHVHALVASGALAHIPGKGYIVPFPSSLDMILKDYNDIMVVNFTRMVKDLARVGFDFDTL